MMKILAAAASTLIATAAHAVVIPDHIYEFDGSATDARGGATMTLGTSATYNGSGATGGLRFTKDQGPTVTGAFAHTGLYSVELFFSLDQVASFRRVIDFKNGKDEDGVYLHNGDLRFYGQSLSSDTNIKAGQMTHLVVTRDESQRVRAYLDGTERFSFSDATSMDAVFSGPDGIARFFRDNNGEASAGFEDFIRLYDRVLTGSEITSLYGSGTPLRNFEAPVSTVPEPSTWAMLILGLGAVGAVVRRRPTNLVPA